MVGSTSRSLSSLALCSILVVICSTMLLFSLSQTSKISQKRRRFVLIFFLLISTASIVSSNPFQSTRRRSPLIRFKAHDVVRCSPSIRFKHTECEHILCPSIFFQPQHSSYKTLSTKVLNCKTSIGSSKLSAELLNCKTPTSSSKLVSICTWTLS